MNDILEAFDAVIGFYHEQLDRDISNLEIEYTDGGGESRTVDTPREYYRQVRGWTDETIEAKRLGWAPASRTALLDRLMRNGHDRETILGTGLFYQGLRPHFIGRPVLPYFDVDGNAAFAIARSVGHPDDHFPDAKYLKALRKDYSEVTEPIYGTESIRDGEPLLITEGIADAITAHQAGYPCVSPVTTAFKHDDRERLLDVIETHDVSRVYVIQDAEPPTVTVDENDRLTIEQFGEGERGGVTTAAYLAEHGDVDARVGALPRAGLDKVDLDDYLLGWVGEDGLAPILASAKPASEHPAYASIPRHKWGDSPDTVSSSSVATGAGGRTPSSNRREYNGESDSALFDLTVTDVAGVSSGHRGTNPLGHHGGENMSENYFVVLDGGEAYDHKYKATYTALTYLLCEANERPAAAPSGELSDVEIYAAWAHAKRQGYLPDDDPVPFRAVRGAAVEHGLVDTDEFVHRDGETGDVVANDAVDAHDGETYRGFPDHGLYSGALVAIESTGLDHGRDRDRAASGSTDRRGDVEPVSALPLAQLDSLDPDERRRAARKRGLEWPTTDELRDRLRERIHDAVRDEESVVIPAPTGAGKSFTVATEQWRELDDVTDGSPVIHLHETREARDSAVEDTAEHGGEGAMLRGRREACPVARGAHDPDEEREIDVQTVTIDGQPASAWLDEQCDEKGVAFSAAHQYLDEHNDQRAPLPCCPPVDDSPDAPRQVCPAVAQWQGVPRDDDGNPAHDVVHATHNFAHVPGLIQDSVVVVDEQPDYTVELAQDRVRRAIAAYLTEIDAPVTTFEAFVGLARLGDSAYKTDAGLEAAELAKALDSRTPSRDWYLTDPDAHTLAPAIARAIWYALRDDPDANGRLSATVAHEPPRLDAGAHDDAAWNREWVTVVVDEGNDVRRIRAAPDLSGARCVIGLDAHPTASLWQLNTRPDIQVDPLLDPDERRLWRRFERGLTVVQVGDKTRPAGKDGKYAKTDRGREPFVRHLREHFGSRFATAITDSNSEAQLTDLMLDAGVTADRLGTMHFGEEKSRNDFDGEAIGAVLGCIDAGDDYVLDALAELGLDATPETDVDEDGEEFRAYGREFTGADADTAAALVASVRENHIAQGAGRYARNADDPNDVATVFVRTDAIPVGFADYRVEGVTHVAGDKQRAIAEAAREHPGATARELRDLASDRLGGDATVSKSHVTKTLAALLGRGVVQRRRGSGAFGADEWHERGDGLTDGAVAGDVDLGTIEDRVLSLYNSLEYEYAIRDLSASPSLSGSADGWGSLLPQPANGGDRTLHDWG